MFSYEDVPDPALQPNGVLIDVQAIAIEGGDVLNRAGGAMTSKPHIVGYNCAGVVREVGAEVTDRKPGDRVTALMASGSHASMVSVPATSTFLVPDGCSIEQAACVPVSWGTAHDCIFEFGRLQAGETVLVQAGTSGVGIACVQLAKRAGATVLATSSSDDKLERLKQYGMDIGVNYRMAASSTRCARRPTGRASTWWSTLSAARRSRGACSASRTVAAYHGRQRQPRGPGIDDRRAERRNASLTGVFFGLETFRSAARVVADDGRAAADIAKGELKVVVDRTYPLSEAAAAHAYIESRAAFGRVVLVP